MSELSSVSGQELEERLGTLLSRIESLLVEVGPRLTDLGLMRREAGMIAQELDRRKKDGK